MTLTVTGAQILSVIGILSAITIMFSKHEKVMKKKAPFSWTNNEEGIEALRNNKGDAVKAALEILRKHGFDNIYNKFNPIKKWLDRIIRKMIGL